ADGLGEGWAESVHPEDLPHLLGVYVSAFESRYPFEMEYRLRRRNGEYRWMLANGVPWDGPNGEFAGYLGSAMRISERKTADEISRNLAHAQRLTILGEFTAMIAHEINQPLAAIMSNTDAALNLLKSKKPPLDEIREILNDIRLDDMRADETIRRIRSLLRKREMDMQPVDLNQIALDALRLASADLLRRVVQIQ